MIVQMISEGSVAASHSIKTVFTGFFTDVTFLYGHDDSLMRLIYFT